jgi:manganese transport protein
MPHNLYLHSSIVQTRRYPLDQVGKKEALRFATIDSNIALTIALAINAAILILSAATFHRAGRTDIAEIQEAYHLLTPMLGVTGASTLFAIALLAAGQNSTLTGTLAGQIVMEGFVHIRIPAWMRRLATRLLAIIPAVIVIAIAGENATTHLLLLSQVILSMQLSFAVIPLVQFTGSRRIMGEFIDPIWVRVVGWVMAGVIAGLNLWFLLLQFRNGF